MKPQDVDRYIDSYLNKPVRSLIISLKSYLSYWFIYWSKTVRNSVLQNFKTWVNQLVSFNMKKKKFYNDKNADNWMPFQLCPSDLRLMVILLPNCLCELSAWLIITMFYMWYRYDYKSQASSEYFIKNYGIRDTYTLHEFIIKLFQILCQYNSRLVNMLQMY